MKSEKEVTKQLVKLIDQQRQLLLSSAKVKKGDYNEMVKIAQRAAQGMAEIKVLHWILKD